MQRASLVDYGKPLQATEAATPKPQGSEVLLRITHCGVCHSDLHLQDGYFDLGGGQKLDVRGNRPLPFTLGHEIAGTVEAVGPEAKGVEPGRFYAAYPWIGCGKCGLCARGDEHLCNAPRVLGVTVDGGCSISAYGWPAQPTPGLVELNIPAGFSFHSQTCRS